MKVLASHLSRFLPGVVLLMFAAEPAPAANFSDADQCTQENYSVCFNGVSSAVVNAGSLRNSTGTMREINRAREESRETQGSTEASLQSRTAWLAAGDGEGGLPLNVWASYSYNGFESDFSQQTVPFGYDADAHSGLAGLDALLFDRLVAGLALGYSSVDSETAFNGGDSQADGFTVAPYGALLLNDIFSIDVSFGYTSLDYEQMRISNFNGTFINGEFDADRYFVSSNLNAAMARDAWLFGFRFGVSHVDETQDAYQETAIAGSGQRTVRERDLYLTQLSVAGDVAYTVGDFEPWFMVGYFNDVDRSEGGNVGGLPGGFNIVQPDDKDEVQLSFGLRWFATQRIVGSVEYTRVEGRDHFDSDLVMATLRVPL